jgi:hypothetical protein
MSPNSRRRYGLWDDKINLICIQEDAFLKAERNPKR